MIYFCWVGEPQLQIYQGVFILSIAKAFFPLAEPVVVLRNQQKNRPPKSRRSVFCDNRKPTEPISRVLLKAVIYLDGGSLPPLKPSFGTRRTSVSSLLMLLRIGFTWQRGSPRSGELLPRLSTLTDFSAVYLCCTFPKVTLGGR